MISSDHEMTTGNIMAFEGPGKALSPQVHALRPLRSGEALVRNLYTTLCGSDLHTFCGLRKEACPTVLGHEITGMIVALGPDHPGADSSGKGLQVGDRVTWSVFSSDPASPLALRGMPQKGTGLFKYGHAKIEGEEVFHGGLSEYCILRRGTAVLKLPDAMPLQVAATLNCAIATVSGALRLAGDLSGRSVLITGAGMLGLACAAMCREADASSICLADIDPLRLVRSLGFGADSTVDLSEFEGRPEGGKAPRDIDVVFDMSGSADAMEYGLGKMAIGGTAIWVGAVFNGRKIQVDAESIIRNMITIKGLHNYNFEDFTDALRFMEANWERYPFAGLVEKEFPLSGAQEAFEYALAHKPIRVGVRL